MILSIIAVINKIMFFFQDSDLSERDLSHPSSRSIDLNETEKLLSTRSSTPGVRVYEPHEFHSTINVATNANRLIGTVYSHS
jgi:hypothetical protein